MKTDRTKNSLQMIAVAAIFLLTSGNSLYAPQSPMGGGVSVNTTSDEWDSEVYPAGACSLREAIQAVTINAAFGGCPDPISLPEIYLPSGYYSLDRTGPGEENNVTGDLDIKASMDIIGGYMGNPGLRPMISGSGDRVLDVFGHIKVTLNHLVVTNGSGVGWGAGIYNKGDLSLDDVTVNSNISWANGGGITSDGFSDPTADLYIHDSLITLNHAAMTGYGGGIEVEMSNFTCDHSSIQINNALKGSGIYIHTAVDKIHAHINQCYIQNNGQISTEYLEGSEGGGIYNGGYTSIYQSMIEYNRTQSGGNIMNLPVDSTAILDVTDSLIDYGFAAYGGGIENEGNAQLVVAYTTFSHNSADYYGGGLFQYSDNGSVVLDHITFADNSVGVSGVGTAIAMHDLYTTVLPVRIDNSILSGPVDDVCYGDVDVLSHHNIETSDTCNLNYLANNNINTNPHIGALLDNGSTYSVGLTHRTLTYMLEPSSIAIDSGSCTGSTIDQRGYLVPADGDRNGSAICDRGGLEFTWLPNYLPLIKKP